MKYRVESILSQGVTLGKIHIMDRLEEVNSDSSSDYIKLDNAIKKSLEEIEEMKKKSPELESYLLVQEYMISDPELKKRILIMLDEGISVSKAVPAVMKEFIEGLANSTSGYLKERTNDMEDAARRIVLNLSDFKANTPNEPFILYTDKPYPSYLIHNKDKILGIISRVGGYTSHTAILARNYDIPFVISKEDYKEGEEVLIDTRKKIIITNPSSLQRNIKKDMKHKKAILHAGYKFLANAASDLDVKKAMEYGFDGVGLYRTEMIFMNSNRPFTALEQYKIYSDAVDALAKDKYIVFRTFDVGGDKQISYVHTNKKGIDNYKQNPYIFENQVMAILKIYTDTKMDIRIMFPMIFEPEEFDYLKGWVSDLAQRFGYSIPPLGMMLETKSALENIKDFKGVKFISIGTNDLVKDIYSLDRETAVDRLDEYKDDLIKKLIPVVDYAERKNIQLSVCGELASIPEISEEFYRIGIKNLSVSPSLVDMLNQAYLDYTNKTIK